MSSTPYAIREDLKTLMTSASLSGISASNIKIRMLPKIGETLDAVPSVLICETGEIKSRAIDMEGHFNREYLNQIVIVDALEGDFATDEDAYKEWQSRAMNKIDKDQNGQARNSLPSVSGCWSVEIVGAATFDRSKLSEHYAYQGIVVRVQVVE